MGQKNALGRSRGGMSTKIHVAVDTTGKPLGLRVTPGQQHDCTVALELLDYVHGEACLADGAYDTDEIILEIKTRRMKAVIPSCATRKTRRRHDKSLYELRYLVEVFFHDIKRFRRIATRYDKTLRCYTGFLHLACAMQWLS